MPSPSSSSTARWSRPIRLWYQLTEPSPLITADAERNHARLLASMALVSIVGSLLSNLIVLIYPQPLPGTLLSLAGTLLVILLYALSRSRYLRAGLVFSTVVSFGLIYVTVLFSPQPAYSAIALLIPLVLSTLFWPPRIMAVLALIGMLQAVSVIGVAPDRAALLIITLIYLGFTTLAIVLLTALRQRDQTQLAQRAAALERSETRYRDLFDRSPVALWEVDFSGVLKTLFSRFGTSSAGLRAHFASHPRGADSLHGRVPRPGSQPGDSAPVQCGLAACAV